MAAVVFSQLVSAQNAENKFAISLYGGINQYKGELGNGLKDFKQLNPLGALSLSTYVSRSFDLGLQGSYGKYGYKQSDLAQFLGHKYEGFMYLDYKLANGYLFSEKSFISPFLTAGIGLAGYRTVSGNTINTFPMDLITPVGAGLKFNITPNFGVTYRFLYAFTNHDEHDGVRTGGSNDFLGSKSDGYAEHLLGITLALGAPKDSDKDGVPDKKDKCPNTPKGVKVDADGCPLDTDGDGVADYLDKCPTVAGLAKFDGCPDTDGDGVQDSMDKCPDTPAGVKVDANGCPIDTDGDGIADYLDKCPTVPGLAKFDGCPDTDGDGIPDAVDKCPTVPGLPEYDGCPKPEVVATPEIPTFKNVLFATDKDAITKQHIATLDEVAAFMNKYPNTKLVLGGHTDTQSTEVYNQGLSERRAAAVQNYLTGKGVDAARISIKGFSFNQPVSDNKTAKGRGLNRRVEFKVEF